MFGDKINIDSDIVKKGSKRELKNSPKSFITNQVTKSSLSSRRSKSSSYSSDSDDGVGIRLAAFEDSDVESNSSEKSSEIICK